MNFAQQLTRHVQKFPLWSLGTSLAAGTAVGALLQNRKRFDWKNKVVVITGGSKGLGLILARDLLLNEAKVVICARDALELSHAKAWLQDTTKAEVEVISCDVSQRESVSKMIQGIDSKYGRIDVLINNAGIIQVAPLDFLSMEDFQKSMAVMYWGTAYPIFAALPKMKKTGGRIVNITSIGGRIGVPHMLPYCAAKFASTGLSLGLRAELKQHNIVVTTVVPGLMRTGSFGNALFKPGSEDDYKWFSMSATLPFVSTDAESAADQIIRACEKGQAYKVIGLPAQIGDRFGGLFPGFTADLMGMVNTALPHGDHTTLSTENIQGTQLETVRNRASLATNMGKKARERFQLWKKVSG
ncbi:MAG: SDR family NAD(P)-dependent oxidoreductase [Oligoflexales bacterium]